MAGSTGVRKLRRSWIDSYLDFVKDVPIPMSYKLWTAVSVLEAALQRKVWIPRGELVCYPNMYICLVGHSGIGKGRAMRIGERILRKLPEGAVSLAAKATSREKLVEKMMRE